MEQMHREVLVCYDIQDNKKRRRIAEDLKDLGLVHIQQSVFWGFITKAEESAVREICHLAIDPSRDRALLVRTDLSTNFSNKSFGYSEYELPNLTPYAVI